MSSINWSTIGPVNPWKVFQKRRPWSNALQPHLHAGFPPEVRTYVRTSTLYVLLYQVGRFLNRFSREKLVQLEREGAQSMRCQPQQACTWLFTFSSLSVQAWGTSLLDRTHSLRLSTISDIQQTKAKSLRSRSGLVEGKSGGDHHQSRRRGMWQKLVSTVDGHGTTLVCATFAPGAGESTVLDRYCTRKVAER